MSELADDQPAGVAAALAGSPNGGAVEDPDRPPGSAAEPGPIVPGAVPVGPGTGAAGGFVALDLHSAKLVGKWRKTAKLAAARHSTACDYYASLDRLYGTLSTVLTAIVGSAIFISLQKSSTTGLRIGAGIVGVIAAILSAVQTGAKYAARSEQHRGASRAYSNLVRQVEELRALGVTADADLQTQLRTFAKTLADVGQNAPNVPPKIWFDHRGVWRLFATNQRSGQPPRDGFVGTFPPPPEIVAAHAELQRAQRAWEKAQRKRERRQNALTLALMMSLAQATAAARTEPAGAPAGGPGELDRGAPATPPPPGAVSPPSPGRVSPPPGPVPPPPSGPVSPPSPAEPAAAASPAPEQSPGAAPPPRPPGTSVSEPASHRPPAGT